MTALNPDIKENSMNPENTIKAITPIMKAYFGEEIGADAAFGLIRSILRESTFANPATNGREIKKDPTGFRVIDPEGGTHDYPDAHDAFPNRLDLILTGENGKTIAIFHRWEHVERITA